MPRLPLAPLLLALLALAPSLGAAPSTQHYAVAGLIRPAEILVDRWGVPHIYAKIAGRRVLRAGIQRSARPPLQIDLWRRRGLGQLSEVFGPAFLEQDRATRLFLYRGDMYREWLAYGGDAKRIAVSFVAGINAYIDLVQRDATLMPLEFRLLGYEPAKWQPEDVVRIRCHGLTRNLTSEVARSQRRVQGKPEGRCHTCRPGTAVANAGAGRARSDACRGMS